MATLVLGPLLRHVDETSATIWVEVADAGTVTVTAGDHVASARTFAAHGHHYALVELEGLAPGSHTPYTVSVGGEALWPEPGSAYPPSVIPTLKPGKPLRMAFGSCRVSVPHDDAGTQAFGVDALRAYALHMAGGDADKWPDLVLFLGDQVYADETSEEMRDFIASRRSLDEPPGEELKDYEEYAHLYRIAWSDPANRWLLSTLPSAMIFDDHDIRDDWNTSWTWRQQMAATSWWHDRIVGGLASYWVYQHLGNLSSADRADDAMWQRITSHDGEGELDITGALDDLAEQADEKADCYRWSFARDFGDQVRLVVVDSRAARVLEPDRRSILDDVEMTWLDDQLQGGFEHVLVGTSLPFLMAPALHHAEAFSEGLCSGAWGKRAAGVGERLRQAIDLEHWAAFGQGFRQVADMVLEVAAGRRGPAPQTITFLSGDVHHSYVATAWADPAVTALRPQSAIVQAVCSPIRNPLPRGMERITSWGARRPLARVTRRLARSAKVPAGPLGWQLDRGPWYDNNLAVLEVRPDGGLHLRWSAGDVEGRPSDQPVLRVVSEVDVPVRR
ncbi:alkaline phosphatase D family protein [Nocardioides euryhalodurans]|uniref:Alkaline phosphatase family protein n=1 Tax=Nocardioides euryhalodurans TaxID=2518370 RepID=A0A4P7GH90_9ACTN|nr:alkaline phosphatase D family protein [Nocardioides euryhalodurans]QBR91215.1 alkaline phosphatase family protein [Nocardioides euryhalodurans]